MSNDIGKDYKRLERLIEQKFFDQETQKEPLHKDLLPYVQEDGVLGRCIHHPLVISVMAPPEMDWHVNGLYKQKQAAVWKAMKEENWNSYVYLHERPYRIDAFWNIRNCFKDDREYWNLLGSIWTDSENIHEFLPRWRQLWSPQRGGNSRDTMDVEEQEMLDSFPDTFTIFRGFQNSEEWDGISGMSWTTDREKAEWFAKRFLKEGTCGSVACGIVNREDIYAYLDGRGEKEIVIDPHLVRYIEILEVK